MTKKEAKNIFDESYIGKKDDKIAKITAWNNFTDSLCKSRQITDYQYNNWTNPYEYRK